ncbi:MAG TPA: hypothetical protein VF552_11830 [Allosphingosinicella sp.]|jgi:hypothetical protein
MRLTSVLIAASFAACALSMIAPAAAAQTGPPCCAGEAERRGQGDIAVELRGADGTSSRFVVLANGDAALYGPLLTIGRIRGQRFMAARHNGRWVTAPPETWFRAAEGTRFSVAAMRRRISFMFEQPIERTGATRVVAGVAGDVYRVPSLRGGTTEAVFTRDPSLERAAEAYYDVMDLVPATGAAAHMAAAARNAGFPLMGELAAATRIRHFPAGTETIRFPSSFSSLRELRRVVRE